MDLLQCCFVAQLLPHLPSFSLMMWKSLTLSITYLLHATPWRYTASLSRCWFVFLFPDVLHTVRLPALPLVCLVASGVVRLWSLVPGWPQCTWSSIACVGSRTSHLWKELNPGSARQCQLNQFAVCWQHTLPDHTSDVLHHQAKVLEQLDSEDCILLRLRCLPLGGSINIFVLVEETALELHIILAASLLHVRHKLSKGVPE